MAFAGSVASVGTHASAERAAYAGSSASAGRSVSPASAATVGSAGTVGTSASPASVASAASVATPGSSASAMAPLVDLNRTVEYFGVPPLVPSDSKKPSVLRKRLSEVSEAVKKPFTRFSKSGPITTPKTRKGVTSRECEFCHRLLFELGMKFRQLTTSADKYKLLTSIPKRFSVQAVMEATGCGQYTARHANHLKVFEGASSWPISATRRPTIGDLKELIINFYLSDNNSRRSPNVRDVIYVRDATGARVQEGKRHILHNLKELFEMFKEENPNSKVGLTTFAMLRPKQCVWPGRLQHQVVCVCEIHKNFEFLLNAANCTKSTSNIVSSAVCGNDECYLGVCGACPRYDELEGDLFENIDEEVDEVTYLQWMHTDSTEIKHVTSNIEDFKQLVKNYIPKIVEHDFVTRRQAGLIDRIKERFIKEEHAISMQVDFAQNYTCIIQNAVMVRYI